jgi:hypothetical protein
VSGLTRVSVPCGKIQKSVLRAGWFIAYGLLVSPSFSGNHRAKFLKMFRKERGGEW